MDISLLIFDGARAQEVYPLLHLGEAFERAGLGPFSLLGASEEVGPVTLDDGSTLEPPKRLRNKPPQELVMLPGYTEEKDVRSLLQARSPMDEHVMAVGGGVKLMEESGLLTGRKTVEGDLPWTMEDDLSLCPDITKAQACLLAFILEKLGPTQQASFQEALQT